MKKRLNAKFPVKDFHSQVSQNFRENPFKSWLGLLPLPLIRFWAGDKFVILRNSFNAVKFNKNSKKSTVPKSNPKTNFQNSTFQNSPKSKTHHKYFSGKSSQNLIERAKIENEKKENSSQSSWKIGNNSRFRNPENLKLASSLGRIQNGRNQKSFQNFGKSVNSGGEKFLVKIGNFLLGIILAFFGILWLFLKNIFGFLDKTFGKYLDRQSSFLTAFVVVFSIIIGHLAGLQVWSSDEVLTITGGKIKSVIIPSRRGQVFIQDIVKGKNIMMTNTQLNGNLFIDPTALSQILKKVSLEEVATLLAGSLNLPYNSLFLEIEGSVKNSNQNLGNYKIIHKGLDKFQTEVVNTLISGNLRAQNGQPLAVGAWLGVDELLERSYPQGSLLASTLGYTSKTTISKEEIIASGTNCAKVATENEDRKTEFPNPAYINGYYGLEQKYCRILAGVNGRNVIGGNKNLPENQDLPVENGKDIYLTIDKGIQQKADDILVKTIKANTNADGRGPKNGSIIVMNPQTGKILALANWPTFDPNNYGKSDPNSWQNIATSMDYEVGSTMKPLTVAAALNEYQTGNLSSKGERLGVSPNQTFIDYDEKGKIYKENDGKGNLIDGPVVKNSQKRSYKDLGRLTLKEVIRDSINTIISDITDSMGNVKLREYFEEKFLFNKSTMVAFAGGGVGGNVSKSLKDGLECQFCYALHGFGQDIKISPIQLMRAFTAIANDGKLVEPYLIEKIVDENGIVDNGSSPDSPISRPAPYPILSSQSTRLVTKYMQAVVDEGYLQTAPRAIPGYTVAAKTGTAEVARPIETVDADGKIIKTPCNYVCNSKRGLFDHSLIGFGPTTNAQVMVMVKISEPRPGLETNFADTTSMPAFLEMMQFSLEYLNVPKDR
jgi:cell division protein FtsI/penicillin-binding protein 2